MSHVLNFWLFLLIVVVFGLVAYVKYREKLGAKDTGGYQLLPVIVSPAERSFLGVLDQAVNDEFRVLLKVRVADILAPRTGISRSHWQTAFNRISAKHFDYVLCRPADMGIACVIELDDASHDSANRRRRDLFLRKACETAGLPFVQIKAKASYSVDSVRSAIDKALGQSANQTSSSASSPNAPQAAPVSGKNSVAASTAQSAQTGNPSNGATGTFLGDSANLTDKSRQK